MSVTSIESGDGKGYGAGVDGGRRLHVFNCPSGTAYTSSATVAAQPAVTTIANSRSNRCSLTIQNQGAVPLIVHFGAADPAAVDFQIAAGTTFTLPCPYDGEVRASGIGGAAVTVVLEVAR